MTITFENDNDSIVYALEKVISYARRTQQIFVAQCVWWIASIIRLDQGLINYIDNLQTRIEITVTSEAALDKPDTVFKEPVEKQSDKPISISPVPRVIQEDTRQDQRLKECEEFLSDTRRLRDIATLMSEGNTRTGRINPTPLSKKYLKKKDRAPRSSLRPDPKISGINKEDVQRRKSAGECLRCAWPSDRIRFHRVKECRRPIKLDKGTAGFPKAKKYQEIKLQKPSVEEVSTEETSSTESSDD